MAQERSGRITDQAQIVYGEIVFPLYIHQIDERKRSISPEAADQRFLTSHAKSVRMAVIRVQAWNPVMFPRDSIASA
jgi:hypothetical protein